MEPFSLAVGSADRKDPSEAAMVVTGFFSPSHFKRTLMPAKDIMYNTMVHVEK